MKYRLKVDTPLGTYYSRSSEEAQDEESQKLLEFVKQDMVYLSFTDENGNEVIVKKGTLDNSVITLEEMR